MNHLPKRRIAVWKTGVLLTLVVLLVFGLMLTGVTLVLRDAIHSEIEDRDARAIFALAQLELEKTIDAFSPAADDLHLEEFIRWEALLSTADYPGILGIQLYSADGELLETIPDTFQGSAVESSLFSSLREGQLFSRFLGLLDPATHLNEETPSASVPLLEIAIPLQLEHSSKILGFARYLVEGHDIQGAFAAVDRQLLRHAGSAFLGGCVLISGFLGFGFYRLHRAQFLIQQRSQALIRANADLSLAVKTNAIGGIAVHLMHDLKNPLSGLKLVIENAVRVDGKGVDPHELEYAQTAIQRMEDQIREISELLQEERQDLSYPLALHEFRDALLHKATPMARERGVVFVAEAPPPGIIESSRANLLLLILYNLIQNAIEVTPPALAVSLSFHLEAERLTIELSDHGPGIPPDMQETLFEAGHSRKSHGTGIGLAISKQLAYHIGAGLELVRTGPDGTTFSIALALKDSTRHPEEPEKAV